ncbi:MAG TPA: DUF2878 domain-containing protein, partial [Gammaproteobacteria bacterium]|nr:DUF2878 domain-containing protein [Gammaproteobacteria bacterium]
RYAGEVSTPLIAPHWILAMWALFATTLTGCLRWLGRSLWLAAILGALGAPASYVAGARLGGVELIDPLRALTALGTGWAIALPVLVRMARGERPRAVAPQLGTERC